MSFTIQTLLALIVIIIGVTDLAFAFVLMRRGDKGDRKVAFTPIGRVVAIFGVVMVLGGLGILMGYIPVAFLPPA